MKILIQIANWIDALNDWMGRLISWLTLGVVVTTFTVVVMRYLFDFGRIWIQESYVWMHAIIFMAGAAWTLKEEGHVRVDIIYRKVSARARCWIDLLGVIFLLIPSCVFIFWVSFPYISSSWSLQEASRETGGLPGVFLLKSVILLMSGLLILQGISMALHNLAKITGHEAIHDPSEECEAEIL
ncbi:MAG: TRAP transporter small permease subunit [Gammaproteobacteria bacterium]|nr:MAG: TRAP transporter small permease subunit [Gammaproteobacteria bacterium]